MKERLNMECKNIEDDEKIIEPKETAEEYKKKGNEFFDKKDYDNAIKYYDMTISLDGNDSGVHKKKGNAYFFKGDYDKAIENYTEAIKINPQEKTYYFNRGLAYANKHEYDAAIENYTEAIKIKPNYEEAYLNRGRVYYYKKEYDKAIEDYIEVININPNNGNVYFYRALAYYYKCEYDKSIEDNCKSIEINPNDENTYNNRGSSYHAIEKYDEAIKDLTAAININPNYILAYTNRATAYKNIDKLDKSKDDEIMAKTLKEFNDYVQSMEFDEETQKNIRDLLLSVSELKKSFLNKKPKRVGHYTKLSTLKFLIKPDNLNNEKENTPETPNDQNKNKKPCLRLNNVSYMNDPSEGVVFLELLKQTNPAIAELVDDLYEIGNIGSRQKLTGKNTFLVSLSNNIDTSLPMWTQYTDDAQGACLVFNPEFFNDKDDSAIRMKCKNSELSYIDDNDDSEECYCLYEVQYMEWNDNEQKYKLKDNLQKSINSICDKLSALNITENKDKEKLKAATQNLLDQVRFLFKDHIYAYEAEERIIKSESDPTKVKFTGDNENFVVPHTYIEVDKP